MPGEVGPDLLNAQDGTPASTISTKEGILSVEQSSELQPKVASEKESSTELEHKAFGETVEKIKELLVHIEPEKDEKEDSPKGEVTSDSILLQGRVAQEYFGQSTEFIEGARGILEEISKLEINSLEDIEKMNKLLGRVAPSLRGARAHIDKVSEIKAISVQQAEVYAQTELEKSDFTSFEEARDKLLEVRLKINKLKHQRLGGIRNKSEINKLTQQESELQNFVLLESPESMTGSITDSSIHSQGYELDQLTGSIVAEVSERIAWRYAHNIRETKGKIEGQGEVKLSSEIIDSMNDEFIARHVLPNIEVRKNMINENPSGNEREQLAVLSDQEQVSKALDLLKRGFGVQLANIFSQPEEQQPKIQAIKDGIEELPHPLRSIVEEHLTTYVPPDEKYADMVKVIQKLPLYSIVSEWDDLSGKLRTVLGADGLPARINQLSYSFSNSLSSLNLHGIEREFDSFRVGLDTKRWEIFQSNPGVRSLLGVEAFVQFEGFFEESSLDKLLDTWTSGSSSEASEIAKKLLDAKNPKAIPIMLMHSFADRGNGSSYFLGSLGRSLEGSPIYNFVQKLNPEQISQVEQIPGLKKAIELINNPALEKDSPMYLQLQEQVVQIGNYFLETESKATSLVTNLFRNVEVGLDVGYEHLSKILTESKDPNVQDEIIECSLYRAWYRKDENAIKLVTQNFDQLSKNLQGKIREIAPNLLYGLIGRQEEPQIIGDISKILGVSSETLVNTLRFVKEVDGRENVQYDPSNLNKYMELANDPTMLPFIQKLKTHGYYFSPNYASALKDLVTQQDQLFEKIDRIKLDFPDFRYVHATEYLVGGERKITTDPYEIAIDWEFRGVEGVINGFKYLNKLPSEYMGKAVAVLIENAKLEIARGWSPENDRLLTEVFDFLNSHNLGKAEIPIYDVLINAAGLFYSTPWRFYDAETIGENGIKIKKPKIIDEATISQVIAEGDSQKTFSYVYNLTDIYRYNLEQEYYEENTQKAKVERDIALEMLDNISDLRLKTLATIRTFNYLLDPDLGDPDLAGELLSDITDPELKSHLELSYAQTRERLERGEEKYSEVFKRVATESPLNREELIKKFDFAEGPKEESLKEELPRVQESMHVSINISYETLLLILDGDGRIKSTWETHFRGGGYDVRRDEVEREMRIRAKGTAKDPHPVYGAVWSKNGRDEEKGGAGGRYGESYMILKDDRIRDRTTFTFDDSFAGHRSRMLTWEDAAYAKAMMNIQGGNYVEAQILGGVTADDIESINIPISNRGNAEEIRAEVERLRQEFPGIKFNFIGEEELEDAVF